MSRTLRGRVAIGSALVFALLLAVLGATWYGLLSRWLDADATMRLTELSDGLRGYLRFDGAAPALADDTGDGDVAAFIHDATQYYQIYDLTTGRLLVQSDRIRAVGLQFAGAQVRAFGDSPRPIDVATPSGRVRLSNSLVDRGTGRRYLLQVGVSLAPTDAALRRYRRLLFWCLAPALIVVALAAWGVADAALSPLGHVADAARTIDVNNLGARLPVRGSNDELDRVVQAFNGTLDRLEGAIGEMRQFSAALAHELRTPLAVLRGEIELAFRRAGGDRNAQQSFANQLDAIDRLKRLIDQILTLARAESGQIVLAIAPVEIGSLAASLVEQLQPVADAHGLELSCDRCEPVVVDGDAGWLERLLLNLLDNAVKFTPAGGSVVVSVSGNGGAARIAVRDTGVGMSAEDAQRAFERFFRADPARSSAAEGAGLGLSLAQWIVHRHHGTITVDSHPGAGSIFTITLPAASGRRSSKLQAPALLPIEPVSCPSIRLSGPTLPFRERCGCDEQVKG
jgi:heavy metal sensor kinase